MWISWPSPHVYTYYIKKEGKFQAFYPDFRNQRSKFRVEITWIAVRTTLSLSTPMWMLFHAQGGKMDKLAPSKLREKCGWTEKGILSTYFFTLWKHFPRRQQRYRQGLEKSKSLCYNR